LEGPVLRLFRDANAVRILSVVHPAVLHSVWTWAAKEQGEGGDQLFLLQLHGIPRRRRAPTTVRPFKKSFLPPKNAKNQGKRRKKMLATVLSRIAAKAAVAAAEDQ
jgi:hypothetical protein